MGASPRENRAEDLSNLAQYYATGRLEGRAAQTRIDALKPLFQTQRLGMEQDYNNILQSIDSAMATRIAGIGQSVGESMASAGVAPGHSTGAAYSAYLAPALAAGSSASADVGKYLMGLRAGSYGSEAGAMQQLWGLDDQLAASLFGQSIGAMGEMKDTTVAGDILGGMQTGVNILAGAAGLPGILNGNYNPFQPTSTYNYNTNKPGDRGGNY